MPSINEVWEQALQINANLATVHNDLVGLQTCCTATNTAINQLAAGSAEINDWLAELRELTASGFTMVAGGIAGIHGRQDNLILLSQHQIEQNRAMLCVLEHISRNTCTLVNEATLQRKLQEQILEHVAATAHMTASAHPDAALVLQREREMREAVERCCPPREPERVCAYKECEKPEREDLRTPPAFEGYSPPKSEVRRTERPTKPR